MAVQEPDLYAGSAEEVFPLTEHEALAAENSSDLFRLGITPHYATLIDPDDPNFPMRLQVVQ